MDKKKILLIEDDVPLRELYTIYLTSAGFTVLTAGDGNTAIELIKNNTDAALVLLDIMLPSMHGVDVLKKIKENEKTKNLKVIMLTNLGEKSVIKNAFALGAWEYLIKMQLTPEKLTDYITKVIANPEYRMINDEFNR